MSDENVGGLVELLPCPFCGGEADMRSSPADEDATWWSVQCGDCGSMNGEQEADSVPDQEFAIAAWNRRALSANGQPVVDEAMVERAEAARTLFWETDENYPETEEEFDADPSRDGGFDFLDPADYHSSGSLAWHNRERVIDALQRKGFLDGDKVTERGLAALAALTEPQS